MKYCGKYNDSYQIICFPIPVCLNAIQLIVTNQSLQQTIRMENYSEVLGTSVLVLSQMSFTCFGTLLNNLLLITLKDLPDISASTYHVLLANLVVTNLFTCTVIKPGTAVYIGYAYSKVR